MYKNLVPRFIDYVKTETRSDATSTTTPSTHTQVEFALTLKKEIEEIGLSDVFYNEKNGFLIGTLPSNTDKEVRSIGFIAHLDTADFNATNVNPQFVENYDGESDITLDKDGKFKLTTTDFPNLKNYKGQTLITTDGSTLLGADDKSGIAEIVTAMEYLINNPEIKHGKIRVGFNPDEEIGLGAHKFDVEKFGCEWAYTMDGGELGELEFENFNAASAVITIQGRNVHPGYAKNKMINSITIANQLISMFPRHETPEHTDKYEGFYHLVGIEGGVDKTTLTYIIRDHDRKIFEERKQKVTEFVKRLNAELGSGTVDLELKDQYYNMREKIEPMMHIIDLAAEAMKAVGVQPNIKAIRGGTDGAQLSFKGLPCPNIFAGGLNFHGRYEFVPIQNMEKATKVIVELVQRIAKV